MAQQPTYLSQGVNFLGFLSRQLGDLAGKSTLAQELIQNADDAKDESGRLSATCICFDITDTALVVSNDAVFRDVDFERIRDVAAGTKRAESGDRTTGAFGVGFISVYQVTDRPEIHSAGRVWLLSPDKPEDRRIEEWPDSSITRDKGTVFRLPWAFDDSDFRKTLSVPPVDEEYINSLVEELEDSLPRAILFLKQLEKVELRRNGTLLSVVTRTVHDDTTQIDQDGQSRYWRILESAFSVEAERLKRRYEGILAQDRSAQVRVAIPDSAVAGLLYATLPTEQPTGLPFHIDADFYPGSDRKAIEFGDAHDPRAEWNRAAIRAAASAVQANLHALRDRFREDAPTFWEFLSRIHRVYQDNVGNQRLPLAAFWESLLPSLAVTPIVFTESGKWLLPKLTRIPTGPQEEAAVDAFAELGLEIVHHDLWGNYRNLLIRRDIGVPRISAVDIYGCLKAKGHTDYPAPPPLRAASLDALWQGIDGVFANEQGSSKVAAEGLLCRCSLAPGTDGRLWPCGSALQSDDGTLDLFAPFMPDDSTFLSRRGVPLLEHFCPVFTAREAIDLLERCETDELEEQRNQGNYDPVELLRWFEDRRAELTGDLAEKFAALHIFPSKKRLCALSDLWLPGGFQDPLGEASLLDTSIPTSLSSFLVNLGVRQLTFADYAKGYVPQAFARNSATSIETKRALLQTLEKHIGQIRDDDEVRSALSVVWIVEDDKGGFRQPGNAYFRDQQVTEVLGEQANYVYIPEESRARRDLYGWLGVQSRPRIVDMLSLIDRATSTRPTEQARNAVVRTLEALGLRWPDLSEPDRALCQTLKTKTWVPVEADATAWHTPSTVFASFNKHLFASQGMFLDVPVSVQQVIVKFLEWLGVGTSPRSSQVVRHLLKCAELNVEPPNGIYRWLNDNAKPSDLTGLNAVACLRIEGRYLRPDQTFWGSHPFGKHRVQLGTALRSYQNLLTVLHVRERPDFNDAIAVLKDIANEIGHGLVEPEDNGVIMQCWLMLSEALEADAINSTTLASKVQSIRCVPTKQGRLHPPSWMFFEDRPGLADKFPDILEQNCIARTDRVWVAMEASGVRRLSEVVTGYVAGYVNPCEDNEVLEHVKGRLELIRTILVWAQVLSAKGAEAALLNVIRFVRVDELKVSWRLRAFGRDWPDTPPVAASAHWDGESEVIYFTRREGRPPWPAISRELALALAPDENPASLSPGLKSVLEAETASEARAQLHELGVASVQSLEEGPSDSSVADTLGSDVPGASGGDQTRADSSTDPVVNQVPGVPGDPRDSFAARFYAVQTTSPATASHNPLVLPPGGPRTSQSARDYTVKTSQVGRTEGHELRLVAKSELGPQGKALADEFQTMVTGDYGKRCQICNRTFVTAGGRWQVNVVHVVPPRDDSRTNHFGDLLGLCGWHFNLLQYGQWALLDPSTGRPFEDAEGSSGWERMRAFILNRTPDIDDWGNSFVGLGVRFSNVYQDLETEPTTIEEEIRYSIPHWEFLCALLSS